MASRVQRKTLSQLRTLLRHVRVNVHSEEPSYKMWHGYIMQQYRANQNVSHKPTARRLRRSAADMVALIQGVQEEQELFRLYSGIDTDSAQYIAKSAQRVGLQMPKGKEN